MSRNKKIILTVLEAIIFAVFLVLLFICVPNKIPMLFDEKEVVIKLISKWFLLFALIFPLILSVFAFFVKNKTALFFIKIFLFLCLYENTLFFIYFTLSQNLAVGSVSELPLTLVIFSPIAMIMLVCSTKLKTLPFNSKLGFKFKPAKETEFLWKQTHIFAKKVCFPSSLILLLISFIFIFFRQCLIETIIFALGTIVAVLIIYFYSLSCFKKYSEMKARRDSLKKYESKNQQQNESKEENKQQ